MNSFNILLMCFLLNINHVYGYWAWKCYKGSCRRSSPNPTLKYVNETELDPFEHYYTPVQICTSVCNPDGNLWPRPTGEHTVGNRLRRFNPINLLFEDDIDNPVFKNMKRIFKDNIKALCEKLCKSESLNTVMIVSKIENPLDINLTPTTNESYTLKIVSDFKYMTTVYINSDTIFGARHALETLSQLIVPHSIYINQTNVFNELAIITSANIIDYPMYGYRGLLIDTSRNYMSIKALRRQLDGMAACKMNVFHWHITDTQSFPLLIPGLENFALYGAYSNESIYTIADVANLKFYAKNRGIRMIVEIDMPSHAGNGWQWGAHHGLGNLVVCSNAEPWRNYCIQPPCGQLNPVNPNVYKMIKVMFYALASVLTPEEYFHIGGDEVFIPCWSSSQEIIKYMELLEIESFEKLWVWFEEKVIKILDNVTSELNYPDKKIILYSSGITLPNKISEYLPNKDRIIVQTWVDENNDLNSQLVELGYDIIVSTKSAWYLDHGFGHGPGRYHTWKKAYTNELPTHENVLGGEAALWTELVYEQSLDTRIWPRTAAIAERLWSNPKNLQLRTVRERLHDQRDRLIQRGLQVDAISPYWCQQNRHIC